MNIAVIFAGGSGQRMNTIKTKTVFRCPWKTCHCLYFRNISRT